MSDKTPPILLVTLMKVGGVGGTGGRVKILAVGTDNNPAVPSLTRNRYVFDASKRTM